MAEFTGRDLIERIKELGEEKAVVIEEDGFIGEILDSCVSDGKIQLSVWYD